MKLKCPPLTGFDPTLKDATYVQHFSYFIASTFWTGHLPASGTWGALIAFLLHNLFFPQLFTIENWLSGIIVIVVVAAIGIWTGDVVENMTGKKDDSRVTIDEVAGYLVAVFLIPAGWQYTIPAFVLCRIFDVAKLPPANQLQNIHGGMGIMIDDIIASIYACALLHLILALL